MRRAVLPTLLLLLVLPPDPAAAAALNCHCFRQRSYDPAKKFSADEYILATAFNSLLSARFGVPKREIVMKKMNGVDGDDLMVALHLGLHASRGLPELIALKHRAGSWKPVFVRLGVPLPAGSDDVGLAEAVGDLLVSDYFGAAVKDLRRLRSAGFSTRETALLVFLSRRTGLAAQSFADRYRKGGESWGEILDREGLSPESLDAAIRVLGRRRAP